MNFFFKKLSPCWLLNSRNFKWAANFFIQKICRIHNKSMTYLMNNLVNREKEKVNYTLLILYYDDFLFVYDCLHNLALNRIKFGFYSKFEWKKIQKKLTRFLNLGHFEKVSIFNSSPYSSKKGIKAYHAMTWFRQYREIFARFLINSKRECKRIYLCVFNSARIKVVWYYFSLFLKFIEPKLKSTNDFNIMCSLRLQIKVLRSVLNTSWISLSPLFFLVILPT